MSGIDEEAAGEELMGEIRSLFAAFDADPEVRDYPVERLLAEWGLYKRGIALAERLSKVLHEVHAERMRVSP